MFALGIGIGFLAGGLFGFFIAAIFIGGKQ